ncbi:MAG TPA: 30S ribosomal protein S3 [Armatimonadota bacterium]
MGQKIHPIGFRVGVIRDWDSKWYLDKGYAAALVEDIRMRRFIKNKLSSAAISRIEIERAANRVKVTLHTARPGIIIGRGGKGVDDLRLALDKMTGKQVHVNVQEIRRPDIDGQLVAESIAQQIVKRVSFKRAMRQSIMRSMRAGAKGIKIQCSGRLNGAEIARVEKAKDGKIPLHTLRADIDYGFAEAGTTYGNIGIKVWIYRGDVLPKQRVEISPQEPEGAPRFPRGERRGGGERPRGPRPGGGGRPGGGRFGGGRPGGRRPEHTPEGGAQ